MRILHLLSNHIYTGPAEPMLALVLAQMHAGHEVCVAVDKLRKGDLIQRISDENIVLNTELTLSVKAGALVQIKDFFRLRDMWKSNRYDIIHCHKSHEHSLAVLSRSASSRTCLVRTLNKGFHRGRLRRAMLKKTDGVFVVAKEHERRLVSEGLLSTDRVFVLGGIVDTTCFSPGDDGVVLRQEMGVAENAPVAGIVSRIKKGRGHVLLLESWLKVHEEIPDARLIVSGRGEWTQKISDMAQDPRYHGSVHVLGYQENLPRLYRSLDVSVILAPGNDGTCRAALQAMACAKAMVCADVGALSDVVQHEKTGLLCRPGDVDELARSLVRLLADRSLLERMGKASRRRVQEVYKIDKHYHKVQALYEHVLGIGQA